MNRISGSEVKPEPEDEDKDKSHNSTNCGDPDCPHCQNVEPEIGAVVAVILSSDKDAIRWAGYGTYQGMEVPPATPGPAGSFHFQGRKTPKLVMENGDLYWGCEACWCPKPQYEKLCEMEAKGTNRKMILEGGQALQARKAEVARNQAVQSIHAALCHAGADVDVALKVMNEMLEKCVPKVK